ncbi:alpha/beta hydrolase fold domain-containing protein [Silvanigrella paludirubra]|uniref:Alpha/beta hydrolase fold domain-containing protein n=1 Tax=Silvanigrella paludirubra TaxID=2499159 RepID=A0A6N6VWS4_9BACT|nr:alpha/beta hydrolase [Silvanigrella paludirubra]KAB8037887.1 alpha/beta hydrolase fold domain-containing protein [Silvanigrella paludirubra]
MHGSAFKFGSKTDQIQNFKYYLEREIAIAIINNRLSGEAHFPATVQNEKAAVRWLKANTKKYQFNSSSIGVFRNSAAANIASILGTTSHIIKFNV